MTISLFFSVNIYSLATREFNRGYGQQDQLFENPPADWPLSLRQQLQSARAGFINEAKSHVLGSLIFTNFIVLIAGGGLSYVLARRSLEPIEEAHQSLERFTADASNELRTPIAAMKSEIEVALMQPKLTQTEARALLTSNLEELDTLTKLSEGLLRLARLEDQELKIKNYQSDEIIDAAVDRILPLAEKKNILIRTPESSLTLRAERSSLIEALVIILDNAIKYSPKKSEIVVTMQNKDKLSIIQVIDKGMGIADADLPHIFKRFYRSDSSRSKQNVSGHGLGLSIADQIIDLHGGTISVQSKLKKGTTVVIKLPR